MADANLHEGLQKLTVWDKVIIFACSERFHPGTVMKAFAKCTGLYKILNKIRLYELDITYATTSATT